MITWFLQSLGIGDEVREHLQAARLEIHHPVILVVGLILLVPVGWFIYRRQQDQLGVVPPWAIIALSVTRIVILAILIVILGAPHLKIDYKFERKPLVALLIDRSASMQLPAGPFAADDELAKIAKAAGYKTSLDPEVRKALGNISRVKLVQNVVQTAALLEPLRAKFDVRQYSFADDLEPLQPDPPAGRSTRIGDVVNKVLDQAGGSPVAGILLFSDGQNTGGQPPADAALRAGKAGAPIFTIPAGSTTPVKDVSVADVATPAQVTLGDTARIAATIQSQGLDGQTVKVELVDGEKILDSKELVLNSLEQQQVELTFEALSPGTRDLSVRVPPLPDEPEKLRANNTDAAQLRVDNGKLRVLYIEGVPRWDFRFLKNAMRRDHGLTGRLDTWPDILLEAELRRRPPEQLAAALPVSLEQLAQYHTIILGDVSPRLLGERFIGLLAQAVRERGVGLVVMAGPLFMPHAYSEQLTDLLPVKLQPRTAGLEAPLTRPFRIEISPEGALSEMMRLYDVAERNQSLWEQMPAYYWCAAADRASPAATVLAWNSDVSGVHGMLPIIASQFAGEGRVMFVGLDSTWLWRQNIGDRFFYRFWGQAIRFVARHEQKSGGENTLAVRPFRLEPGEVTHVELFAFAADGLPRKERKLPVAVSTGASARVVMLEADAARKGRYTGNFVPELEGDHQVRFDPGDSTAVAAARFFVKAAAEELRFPGMNRGVLQALAVSSGGKLVELPDLATIPAQLKGASQLVEIHREASLWDNWLTVVTLAMIYSVDVGLRRFRGLS